MPLPALSEQPLLPVAESGGLVTQEGRPALWGNGRGRGLLLRGGERLQPNPNAVKRLNNDAAVKAVCWRQQFGSAQVSPPAVLSGFYKLNNLPDAQEKGLFLFWAHDLAYFVHWIVATKE